MKNAILSILRHLLTFGGGAVIANNPSISENTANVAIGAVVSAVGLLWGARDEYVAERQARFSNGTTIN